jgi:hypothetical protein
MWTCLDLMMTCLLLAHLGAADDVAKPPQTSEFVIVPLRVHILTADGLPEVDCKLTDDDIRRIVGKVNIVWSAAGVHWGLDSIVREPAAKQERFRTLRDDNKNKPVPLGAFRLLAPEASRAKDGLNVYYIHKFSVNGVYLGDHTAFVQETAKLREVEGGIDEPLPRVTAHELGHSLGLPHRQDRTNLLASGTTGTTMNAAEVEKARGLAKKTKGAMVLSELKAAIESEKVESRLVILKKWLEEVEKPTVK